MTLDKHWTAPPPRSRVFVMVVVFIYGCRATPLFFLLRSAQEDSRTAVQLATSRYQRDLHIHTCILTQPTEGLQ